MEAVHAPVEYGSGERHFAMVKGLMVGFTFRPASVE